jgi:ribosomal protein S18 acetylase RimI-like enzyme
MLKCLLLRYFIGRLNGMVDIRKCVKADEKHVIEICYKTGFMGEDLTGLGLFNDKTLFGYLFCSYYVRYETDNCFISVDSEINKPIGYVIGTSNTKRQRRQFILRMGWIIALRILTVTVWRYPETIRSLLYLSTGIGTEVNGYSISKDYPAHLHINITEGYQRMGIGERLIHSFEENIKSEAKGIHLSTTTKNTKAVPFYQKMGYKILNKGPSRMWRGTNDAVSLIFAKEL